MLESKKKKARRQKNATIKLGVQGLEPGVFSAGTRGAGCPVCRSGKKKRGGGGHSPPVSVDG